ncbi:MAG: multicopper oxidase domain-containing protein [Acidobacteria bacterium]|nr:multicopper oxidase domain-containing protein [Acidobacteriota bacterium]
MRRRATVAAACAALVIASDAIAQEPASRPLPIAAAHDNRRTAGHLEKGTLTLRLEIVTARWLPEGEKGPTRTVQVFAEEGRAPEVPGPLVRVPEGTSIHVTVRNRLTDAPVRLHGMMTRPGDPAASVEIAPGAVREFRFKAGEAGTYFYWARTTSPTFLQRRLTDSQLSGAFVVDPERVEERIDDRVFVISEWLDASVRPAKFSATINGASWPMTERLALPFGQAAHWRVVNASFGAHPMHLHGTFYTVESRGDAGRDTLYGADGRRLVTTELMEPGTTMAMRWVPDRVGNWLFHCHILAHVTGDMRLADMTPEERKAASHHEEHNIEKAMAGLVLGITVPPGDETAASDLEPHVPRPLTLTMIQTPNQYGAGPGFGFRIIDDAAPTPPVRRDSVQEEPPNPSPTLVLTQGQPVVIKLVSQLEKETQIHWHGIELEIYNDGVPGWSGNLRQITPSIAPGASYDVRYTPPRAGTFIYHTHAHDRSQLGSGLYGALVVVEPGKPFDPAVERIVLLGGAGPGSPAFEVNRSTNPLPMDFKVGVTHRIRLINISPNSTGIVTLRNDAGPVQWRPVSKDGADLPPAQTQARPARQVISVGETYDFEYTPSVPGDLRLEVFRRGPQPVITSLLVRAAR